MVKPSSHLWVSSWEITCCKDRTAPTAPRVSAGSLRGQTNNLHRLHRGSLRAAREDSRLSSVPWDVPQLNSCPKHVSSPGTPITSNHGVRHKPAARIAACSNTRCSSLRTMAGAFHRLLQPLPRQQQDASPTVGCRSDSGIQEASMTLLLQDHWKLPT